MLTIGTDKSPILSHLPESFLFIDDGFLIDALTLPKRRKVTRLDLTKHFLNPLKGMNYKRAEDFVALIDGIFSAGSNTLTKQNSGVKLMEALLTQKAATLADLTFNEKDSDEKAAAMKVRRLLLSPLLNRVLTGATNIPFTGILLARLDRATLGDFDCFVLGNLLISAYSGPVVIPDFGFYAIPSHIQLIRQNRLIAGVNTLDEVLILRQQLLLMDGKIASHATYDDAAILAQYAGIPPHINAHADFIEAAMKNDSAGRGSAG